VSGDFLSRWSRRKIEVKRAEESTAAPDGPATPAAEAAATPEELSAEEVAALPPVESLTAESDIAGFLRKGVPQALRNAALRRAWALDPEIRDYVGDARDYAYDWNVPGGVPGTGPMDPGTDVAQMVKDVFGRSHDAETMEGAAQAAPAAAVAQDAPGAEPLGTGDVAGVQAADESDAEPEPEPVHTRAMDGEVGAPKPRTRHGGAKPVWNGEV
jgi:hypothetical protein